MADKKITELNASTTLATTDIIPVVTSPSSTPETKKITLSNLMLSQGLIDGWVPAGETWTYASATTINIPAGGASKYSVGDKFKLTNGTVKYFYATTVADTLLTVTGGSDYSLSAGAISANYYSKSASPLGFPQWFNYTSTVFGSTGSAGTYSEDSVSSRFSIVGRTINLKIGKRIMNKGSWGGAVQIALPILPVNQGSNCGYGGHIIASGVLAPKGLFLIQDNTLISLFVSSWATAALDWAAVAVQDYIAIRTEYEI
jgi:hypothetical protein